MIECCRLPHYLRQSDIKKDVHPSSIENRTEGRKDCGPSRKFRQAPAEKKKGKHKGGSSGGLGREQVK